ncbi:hypothetical protein AUJ46_00285 [Candidatus Peregrinibacteria bacterium CG1_02_54_53]|nr:MAG: hypothetical protein AUJ46_00285 [Candidatus Peregrinibacteria bacterium CG1_02_54_53]
MKKLSLLIGTLGGAMAGYLFSNKKLRKDLAEAKDAETAARLLGKHLQRDGKKLAAQAQEFIDSDEVQHNLKKAKSYTQDTFETARKELMKLVNRAEEAASTAAQSANSSARTAAKKAAGKAKRTARRMKTKVRKLL